MQVLPLLLNLLSDFEIRDAGLWHHVLHKLQQASQFRALLDGLVRLAALAQATGAAAADDKDGAAAGNLLSMAEGPSLWQAALEGVALTAVRAGVSRESVRGPCDVLQTSIR